MTAKIESEWIDYFTSNGFPAAKGISAGMEGAVYSLLDGELVGKVWSRRTEASLQQLKVFYEVLKEFAGPIATPEIKQIAVINGALVTFERFLPGMPLQDHLRQNSECADDAAIDAVAKVLAFLRTVHPRAELACLSVLDEPVPPWVKDGSWSEVVGRVIATRMARYGDKLREAVPDVDEVQSAVEAFLRTRDSCPMTLLHGDICGANIMVNEALQPLAVFDFGFLSMIGDPAFDASISSAIFDMYGPHARKIDDQVTGELADSLSYEPAVLLAYRAVYGLITSNAYSEDGSDGHFRWCVSMLERDDVRASLGFVPAARRPRSE